MLSKPDTYKELLDYACKELKAAGIEEYEAEAKNILCHSFNISFTDLIIDKNKAGVDEKKRENFFEFVKLRKSRKPFQYISGVQNFCGFDFNVNETVLIPRFDTEILVEKVLEENRDESLSVLDLCTGSGAIAVSLKKLGKYELTASDISDKALELAKSNAKLNKAKVEFVKSDMFEALTGQYDIIVSNPPYIPSKDIEELETEVKDYEPRLALDGKEDGLHFYRIISEKAKSYLKDGGRIYLEIGYNQAEDIRNIFKEYKKVEVFKDLAGKDRVLKILK